ncbi:toll-like receptor 4b, duplicate a, partial [Silurus meridionalis]
RCQIQYIADDAFHNVRNVVILILTGNPISYIAPDSLNSLHKLQRLLLVDIGLLSLNAQFSNLTNLQELKVGTNKIQTIALPQFMISFKDFRVLDLHANNISSLKVNHTVVLREMREMYIYKNQLPMTLELSHLHLLEKLVVISHNVVFLKGLSDMPKLQHVDLSASQLELSDCCSRYFTGMPNIHTLNLSFNHVIYLMKNPFSGLESMEILDIQYTKLSFLSTQFRFFKSLKHLQYLDISYSQSTFLRTMTFSYLRSLNVLKISGNQFQEDALSYIFTNVTTLEVLQISNCGIENIDWRAFQGLSRLSHLFLSQNKLMALDFVTHPYLKSLTLLHVGANSIFSIPPHILQNLPTNLSDLDLSFNPIECSCSQIDFITWILNHQHLLQYSTNVSCKILSHDSLPIRVTDFDVEDCVHIRRLTIVLCICAAIFLILVSVLTYKFQFYLRYAYILLRGYNVTRQQEFSYDAFVIYSSKDESWVMDELVENLENGCPPIQLCLHVRDFEAGKAITSNIIEEGIMGSRKIIVVVSKHFIESSWCRFEFEVAQSWLVMQGNANIIIIILEDVEEEKSKKVFGLHKHLRNNTYLKWSGNPVNNMRFWIRLRKAVITKK